MKIKNIYLLLLLACLWGPSFLFIKIAVVEIPPIMLAALRIGIAAMILNLLLLVSKKGLPKRVDFWKKTLIAGFFAQALPFVLINWGEQFVDSSLASVLNGLVPIFTIMVAHFSIEEEKITKRKLSGVLLGFFGLVVLVLPSLMSGAQGSLSGTLAITIAALSYGIGLTYIRKHFSNTSSFMAPAAQLLSVSIYLVPFAFFLHPDFSITTIGFGSIGSLLVLSLFGTAIAFIVYFKLIEQSGATYASLVTYIMPIFGVLLGVTILDESLTLWILLGAICILLGIRLTRQQVASKPKKFIEIQFDPSLYSKFR